MCKRLLTFVLLTLCFGTMIAQPRKVIVMMADKYDAANIAVKTQYMTKAQRRDFVISERKSFCMASQQNVIDFLNGFKDKNSVSDIKQFWSFNGFACEAEEYVIEQLRERKDVAAVYYDETRKMLPDMAEAKPVNSKDNDHCDFSSVGPVTWAYGDYVGDYNDYPYQNGDASQPGLIRPDISAPGKNITSLNFQTGNQYIEYDGTSMATPCVAGVLALLLEAEPELLPAQLDSIIELTAASAGNTVKNNIVGSGRIDALAAINALYYHGPTNLTAEFDGTYVDLSWNEADNAVSYSLYRDGMRIANNLTTTTYTDNLSYGGNYTYYVKALLDNDMTTLPSNYVFIEKEIEVEAEEINGIKVALTWNMPDCTYDGFESGDLYQNMWINDGSYPWEVTMEDANSGSYCVKSTNTSMFSTSSITLGVTVPATCVVSYYAKVSCFPLNGGGFFIDNVQQGETLKDEIPWTRYSVALSAGNHLLEWKYANQLAEGGYDNSFYIDDITVGYPFNIYLMNCNSGEQTLLAENVVDAQYLDDEVWVDLPIGTYKYGVSADGGNTISWSEALEKDYEGLDEIDVDMVSVYPNPAKDMLTIECAGAKRITIVSMLGEVVYDAAASSDIMTIDLGYCQSGMYFLNVVTDKGQLTKKITVSK